ncbi:hypothetical protein CASFOL_004960 [Castilleja foliolosa]|uniref:Uncharacterized protein n=1 Tax=Castilleja foliolosa TaxID=1961234 RepID=A0ABD3EBY7_9LAMI
MNNHPKPPPPMPSSASATSVYRRRSSQLQPPRALSGPAIAHPFEAVEAEGTVKKKKPDSEGEN